MRVRFAAITTAIAILTIIPRVAARAQSKFTVGAAAGIAFPSGDLSNWTNTGYNVAVTVGATSRGNPLGFRAEGTFSEFDWNDNACIVVGVGPGCGFHHRVAAGIANLTYDIMPSGTNALYIIGGAGIYGSYDNQYGQNNSTVTSPGFNLGGGYRFALSGFNCYLEARYHYVTNGTLADDHYIPITFGVSF